MYADDYVCCGGVEIPLSACRNDPIGFDGPHPPEYRECEYAFKVCRLQHDPTLVRIERVKGLSHSGHEPETEVVSDAACREVVAAYEDGCRDPGTLAKALQDAIQGFYGKYTRAFARRDEAENAISGRPDLVRDLLVPGPELLCVGGVVGGWLGRWGGAWKRVRAHLSLLAPPPGSPDPHSIVRCVQQGGAGAREVPRACPALEEAAGRHAGKAPRLFCVQLPERVADAAGAARGRPAPGPGDRRAQPAAAIACRIHS